MLEAHMAYDDMTCINNHRACSIVEPGTQVQCKYVVRFSRRVITSTYYSSLDSQSYFTKSIPHNVHLVATQMMISNEDVNQAEQHRKRYLD